MKYLFILFILTITSLSYADGTFSANLDISSLKFIKNDPCAEPPRIKVLPPKYTEKTLGEICNYEYYPVYKREIKVKNSVSSISPLIENFEMCKKNIGEVYFRDTLFTYAFRGLSIEKQLLLGYSTDIKHASQPQMSCMQQQMDEMKNILANEELQSFLRSIQINQIALDLLVDDLTVKEKSSYGILIKDSSVFKIVPRFHEASKTCSIVTSKDITGHLKEKKDEINTLRFFAKQNLATTLADLEDAVNNSTRAPAPTVCSRVNGDELIKEKNDSSNKESNKKSSSKQ